MYKSRYIISVILLVALLVMAGCTNNPITPSQTISPSTPVSTLPVSTPTLPATTPIITVTGSITPATTTTQAVNYTPPITKISTDNVGTITTTNFTQSNYVVFAWNELGMHCANPSYDTAILLPPYNSLWAQVVKRGNPPQVMTGGLEVEYSFANNTYSYGKGKYSQFWDNVKKVFGVNLAKDKGLNLSDPAVNNGLAGLMAVSSDHFEAVGTPLTPIDDTNNWNPYQVAIITVKDSSGNTLAKTRTMAPVSDEIDCAKCHGVDAFSDILQKHDASNKTNLQNQKPVLCAGCHGDPALGVPLAGPNKYLSDVIHGRHADLSSPPGCYDCHPGQVTQCSRSISHASTDGNCTACHGSLSNVSDTIEQGRVPWVSEPKCASCHAGIAQVDTGNTLYRNATGHGGIYCTSCHSSPHAMVPSSQLADNYQAIQYQGKALPIGDCAVCHSNSKGDSEMEEYMEAHGGANPDHANMCYICHTSVNTADTTQWPHSFQWKSR